MQLRWIAVAVATALSVAACTDQDPPVAPSAVSPPALSVARGRRARGHIARLRERAQPSAEFELRVESLGGTTESSAAAGIVLISGLTSEAAKELAADPEVLEVLPDVEIRLDPVRRRTESIGVEALHRRRSDFEKAELYARQWNMDVIHAPVAWRAGKLGSSEVRVAILDSGIDPTHPDVAGLVDLNLSGSFFTTDVALGLVARFFPGSPIWTDLNGHGTHVANTIASNGIGTAGLTSRTRLIAVKVLDALGNGSLGTVLNGIAYAASPGVNAHVINLSVGTFITVEDLLDPTDPDLDTIEEATAVFNGLVALFNDQVAAARAAGSVVVVAAGNHGERLRLDDTRFDIFCEAIQGVCVSSTGPRRGRITGPRAFVGGFSDFDEPSVFTNFGDAVDLAAPGGNYTLNAMDEIVSGGFIWQACSRTTLMFVPDADPFLEAEDFQPDPCATSAEPMWAAFAGTSQAAPHVSGLAALLAAEVGNDRPAVIEARMFHGADDLGRDGRDKFFGRGRINVPRALFSRRHDQGRDDDHGGRGR